MALSYPEYDWRQRNADQFRQKAAPLLEDERPEPPTPFGPNLTEGPPSPFNLAQQGGPAPTGLARGGQAALDLGGLTSGGLALGALRDPGALPGRLADLGMGALDLLGRPQQAVRGLESGLIGGVSPEELGRRTLGGLLGTVPDISYRQNLDVAYPEQTPFLDTRQRLQTPFGSANQLLPEASLRDVLGWAGEISDDPTNALGIDPIKRGAGAVERGARAAGGYLDEALRAAGEVPDLTPVRAIAGQRPYLETLYGPTKAIAGAAGDEAGQAVADVARAAENISPAAPEALPPLINTLLIPRKGMGQAAETTANAVPAGLIGHETTATGADVSKPYTFRYRVASLDDLIPSHTDALTPNPAFPAELQPRARDRAASRIQINRLANDLSPDELLTDRGTLDRGPMIVGPDNVVESGNGRVLALRSAAENVPERFAAYRQQLVDSAADYGLDPAQVAAIDRPVLVRERATPVDRAKFASEANESAVLQMGATEHAAQDARRISDEALQGLTIGETQSADEALRSPANRHLAEQFVRNLPPNERAALVDPSGALNQQGLQRLKAGIFAKTYPGEPGQRLTRAFYESLDTSVRTIEQAMFDSLPDMAKAEGLARAGERPADYAMGVDLAAAVDMLARLRQQQIPVPQYLMQGRFDAELTPFQDQLLRFLDEFGRSRRVVRNFLQQYAGAVEAADPKQLVLMGDPHPTKEQIVERLARTVGSTALDQPGAASATGTAALLPDSQLARTGVRPGVPGAAGLPGTAGQVAPRPPSPARAGAERMAEDIPRLAQTALWTDQEVAARLPNLSKLDVPEPVRVLMTRMAEDPDVATLTDGLRQGVITHQTLINDLAPRLGMTVKDFTKAKRGQAFNERELLALRAAVLDRFGAMTDRAQAILARGGIGQLGDTEKVALVDDLTELGQLQAVGRGAAATAGRALNQFKIVITQEMARAITGGNEAVAAARALAKAKAQRQQARAVKQALEATDPEQRAAAIRRAVDAAKAADPEAEAAKAAKAADAAALRAAEREYRDAERAGRRAETAQGKAAEAAAQRYQKMIDDAYAAETSIGPTARVPGADEVYRKAVRDEMARMDGADADTWASHFKRLDDEHQRALREAQRLEAQAGRVAERQSAQARKALEKLSEGGNITDAVLENYLKLQATGDPLATAQFIKSLTRVSNWDRISVIRYGSMLSATSTHLTNTFGNASLAVLDVGLTPVAAGIDVARAKITGGPRTRYAGETLPKVRGIVEGALAGAQDAWITLKTGINARDAAKLDRIGGGFGAEQLPGLSKLESSATGRAVNRGINAAAEMPLRLLTAADNVFRGAAHGGAVRAIAYRTATQQGLSGTARANRVQEIVEHVTDYPDLLEEADKIASRLVLQESRQEIGRFSTFRQTPGPVGVAIQTIVPFVRTPYNIAAQGAGMTPAGFLGVIKAARDGKTGEATDRAARALFGTAVMGIAGSLAAAGYMTGPRPEKEGERNTLPQGWQPWAFRVPAPDGKTAYVSYQNWGPVSVPLATSAILADMAKRDTAGLNVETLGRTVAGVGQYMSDQTFMKGIGDLLNAVRQPQQYGEQWVEGLVTQAVPYAALQRQIQRAMGMASRDPHGALEAILAASPATASMVAPRLDDLGQEIPQEPSGPAAFLSPVRITTERDDPALAELRRLDVGMGSLGKAIVDDGTKHKLTVPQQQTYQRDAGQAVKAGLNTLITQPFYQQADDKAKTKMLERIMDRSRELARDNLLESIRGKPAATTEQITAQAVALVDAYGQKREYDALGKLPGITPEQDKAAGRFSTAVSNLVRDSGGKLDRDRALRLAAQQDGDGYAAYQLKARLLERDNGRIVQARANYWASHPLLQQYFTPSPLDD